MTNESMAVDLEVQGMTCSNCALGVTRFLEKKGMKDVYVISLPMRCAFTCRKMRCL